MKQLTYMMFALAIVMAPMGAMAKEAKDADAKVKKEKKPAAPKPELKDLTLNGKIVADVQKGKDGKPDKTTYSIVTEAGAKVKLPAVKDEAINMAALVDANVVLTGKGKESNKGDKVTIHIKEIASIVKAGEAAEGAEVPEEAPAAEPVE